MNDIINKVASLGGTISTTDISHLSEYKQVLRAKERGDLIRLRHGVYAAPEALLNTMIDVEEDNTEWCCMPIQCLDISSSVYDSPACFLHSHCQ